MVFQVLFAGVFSKCFFFMAFEASLGVSNVDKDVFAVCRVLYPAIFSAPGVCASATHNADSRGPKNADWKQPLGLLL